MFIKTLSLRNFKSIRHAEFKFKRGIICFTGNNGEGKSTVLHAILLLLFNTTYEGTLKDSIRWGEKEFEISMTFEHEGSQYEETLLYSLTKGSDRTLIDLNTKEEWTGASAISKLADIIDPEQARAAIVSMENEQNLVTTTPSQRREYLKKIYSLEFKQELSRIASDIENTENDIISVQSKKDVLEASEFPLKEERELMPEEDYEKAKSVIESIEKELKRLEEKQSRVEELYQERISLSKAIKGLKESIDKAEYDIEYSERCIGDDEKEIDELKKTDYDALLAQELQSMEEEYSEKKKDLQKLLQSDSYNLEQLPTTLTRVSRSYYDQLNGTVSELSHAIKESSSKLEILRKGKCPTCGREISPEEADKEEAVLQGLKDERDSVYKQLKEEADRIDAVKARNDEITESRRRLEAQKEDHCRSLEYLSSSYELSKNNAMLRSQTKKAEQEGEISRINSNIMLSQTKIDTSRAMIDLYKSQIEEKTTTLRKLEEEYSKYEDVEVSINECKSRLSEPRALVEAYEDDLVYNRSIKVYNEEMKKKAEERDNQVAELSETLEDLRERKSMITVAKGIVQKEFPSFVISRMIESLSVYVNEFLEKVYPKYTISIEESKNSLNILYGDYKTDVKMASGFEKSAFSLAYMYALGKIQAYGLLICDEGDSAASDENSARFYRMLGRSTDWLGQIMCITHKEDIKELLKNDFRAQVFTVENGEYREEIA